MKYQQPHRDRYARRPWEPAPVSRKARPKAVDPAAEGHEHATRRLADYYGGRRKKR